MSENKVLSTIYEQVRILKTTLRKNIILLKNRSNGQLSVAKVQIRNDNPSSNERTVRHEGKFLLETQGHIGIPTMRWVGKDGVYDVLIVQKLGKTIQELFESCQQKFSLKTVAMLGLKMLKIISNYHSKGFIHRNVSPKAFQIGIGLKNSQLYFNDLMDSLSYLNKKNFKHIQNKSNQRLIQITPFMSLEQINGDQASRRTDIESLVLTMIYFLKGQLPWSAVTQEKISNVEMLKKLAKQRQVLPKQICKGLPKEFEEMLVASLNMGFEEEPKYFYYIQQLLKVMYRANVSNDGVYDWLIKPNSKTNLRPELERLRISRNISGINIKLRPYEDLVLESFYEPYAHKVEIDEITEKYSLHNESRLNTQQLYDDPLDMPSSGSNISTQKRINPFKEKDKCLIY